MMVTNNIIQYSFFYIKFFFTKIYTNSLKLYYLKLKKKIACKIFNPESLRQAYSSSFQPLLSVSVGASGKFLATIAVAYKNVQISLKCGYKC